MPDDTLKPIGGDTSSDDIFKKSDDITLKPMDDNTQPEKPKNVFTESSSIKPEEKSGEDVMVYSMPKQFKGAKESKNVIPRNTPHEKKKKGRGKKLLIIGSILFLLVGGGTVAAYFLVFVPNMELKNVGEPVNKDIQEVLSQEPVVAIPQPEEEFTVYEPPIVEGENLEPSESPEETMEREPESVNDGLVQKIAVSYDELGNKITEAVLSLETEIHVNYGRITIAEYIKDTALHPEYFSAVAGKPYEVQLRGEEPTSKSVLTITYTDTLLESLDIIPADLRIGYLSPPILAQYSTTVVWNILKAQDLNTELNSISSIIDGVEEGIYAIVPLNVNAVIGGMNEESETEETNQDDEDITILPGLDSDQDMLTDIEELLYGTSPIVQDSDLDGYPDGEEVLALFSPARGEGVILEADTQFARYIYATTTFSILLPNSFARSELAAGSYGDVLVQVSEDETVFIGREENPEKLSIIDWVVAQSPEMDTGTLEAFTTHAGKNALVVMNKTTYYVDSPETGEIYIFSYSALSEYNYFTTFRMMVESFETANFE